MITDIFNNKENMDMEHAILNYFTHKKIVDTLARYDLYYNISILYLAHTVINDDKKADDMLSELELQINPEIVLETMYNILKEYHNDEHLFTIFEENIKMQSCMKALDDFIHEYEEIPKLDEFIQKTQSNIIMDQFFDENMQKQFHDTVEENKIFWGKVIDAEAATQILHAIQNTEYDY